jgi:hypothetical protein
MRSANIVQAWPHLNTVCKSDGDSFRLKKKFLVTKMLNYRNGLSKEMIRLQASSFKLQQEAFNRPYALRLPTKKNVGALKPRKEPQKKYASV